ncbi:MAG: M3 family metallopeptidase [Chthoniobacterales bacterium]|nr:M3 family metallopeptidase [Chthoniobacterales bacterium]
MTENPLLQESSLDFHYPPFDKIKDEHFAPAYEKGMADQLKEIEPIASSAEPPTFENTVVALEKAGDLLGRVDRIFSNLAGANTNPALQKVESDMAPKLAAQQDAIFLNGPLFKRVETIYNDRDKLGLDDESKWLVERYYKDFVRAGAKLSEADKTKLKAMNAELAELQTKFAQNVLKEKNAESIVVDDRADLKGLSDNEIAAAAVAAKEAKNKAGTFVLPLQNTTQQPALTSLKSRALRERIMKTSLARNSHGGDWDNRQAVLRMVKLRAERANLLGYPNHAAYQLEDQTAKNVETVNKLLGELAPPAVANARKEAADMQQLIDREKGGFQLASWDWAYYSDQVRQARYAFDESEIKPYFELNHVLLDGVFYAATQLYGITFKERHDLPVYQPDVRVFAVSDKDGRPLGIFLADYYARPSKRGGAWMNEYVNQSDLLGMKPVVANHLNIPKPEAGQPTLLTFDEVTTMFHEFGHALHGMFSHVKYPRFSGTSVPRDFVEYPSQVNEMWASWPQVLEHYAKHYKTGEPMPKELLDKVLAAEKFNQGFKTTEYLAATLLDQAWHQISPAEVPNDVLAFEASALKKAGVDLPTVPPRYRTTYFSHAFAGGYSAGYYSYIWAEELDADSVEWFKQHGGLKRENGDHFRDTLLSRGGSKDAMKLFHDFTGRDPWIEPLLKRRGLDGAADPKATNEAPPPQS